MRKYLPASHAVAGKTGTTDDLRDSWFAGFTGDRLGVVWIGRDDNQSADLTGSSGALTIWGAVMKAVDASELALTPPPGIGYDTVDPTILGQNREAAALRLPFLISEQQADPKNPARGSADSDQAPAAASANPSPQDTQADDGLMDRFFDLFR
jgi:penicillin-binding protein 1B